MDTAKAIEYPIALYREAEASTMTCEINGLVCEMGTAYTVEDAMKMAENGYKTLDELNGIAVVYVESEDPAPRKPGRPRK